jgi:aerobic-type carbon monoxide dehydrogenase small subunit (CoxS/CutS family)
MNRNDRPRGAGELALFGADSASGPPGRDELSGLSRRAFLEFSTLSAAQAAMAGVARATDGESAMAQDTNSAAGPPEAISIALDVNGVERSLRVEPRTTLAEALRGALGLTGVKVACDRGACSACTVWLDGAPVCSCMTLAVEVGARKVTTIEGLARGEALHAVQAAFIAHDALQCGYCTPGLIMSCAALLERNPDPTAEDVEAAIAGHYCRCGAYPHVVAATLAAAEARRG